MRARARDRAIARLVRTHAGACVHDLCRVLTTDVGVALPLSAPLMLQRVRRVMQQVIEDEVTRIVRREFIGTHRVGAALTC